MRVVIQRVKNAQVEVNGKITGSINLGLLVFLGIGRGDTDADARFIAEKLVDLRLFADAHGKMNLSLKEVAGEILLISQFTLYGDCRKGRRPGFDQAAEPAPAQGLYEHTIQLIRQQGISCQTGVFAAHMNVASLNDGPVTFILDSTRLF